MTYLRKIQSWVSKLFVESAVPAPAAAPPPVLVVFAKTGGRLTLQGSGEIWRAQNGSMVMDYLLSLATTNA